MLEEDANNLLNFMAANGLVANPSKTAFILLNAKKESQNKIEVKIGNSIIEKQKSAKLLGMKFEETMNWQEHIHGKGGVITSLNQRLFLIRRLKNQLNKNALNRVAESIFTSKIRYGLQLMGKVRYQADSGIQKDLKAIQMEQNKLVRLLNNARISDKKSTISLLDKANMLSVNQINAQIKLTEIWKAVNRGNCPIKVTKMKDVLPERPLRSKNEMENNLLEHGVSEQGLKTFVNDGVRLWNKAPKNLKNCTSLFTVKKEIRKFVKSLPI